jgi:hypothetical protein
MTESRPESGTPETRFSKAGFVEANARAGAIYLCWNNLSTHFYCALCGAEGTAQIPLEFFLEGDTGSVVCQRCALDRGFTLAPRVFDELVFAAGGYAQNPRAQVQFTRCQLAGKTCLQKAASQ